MFLRSAVITACALLACGNAFAQDCRLDQANYTEVESGATIEFKAKDHTTDAAATVVLLDVRLPNVAEVYPGDVTWSNGGNTRPFGWVGRQCTPDVDSGLEPCKLWNGSIYALTDGTAENFSDGEQPAPPAVLLVEFGRSLFWSAAFSEANPSLGAFDVFTLTGCRT